MLFDTYNPLYQNVLEILDQDGNLVRNDLEPKIDTDTLLSMYRVMNLGRIADVKAIQFQRQGRLLTYAPNQGQEAAQVGVMAAAKKSDWLATSFREVNAMLYHGVTLKQIFLYWFGNEMGSRYDTNTRVLPVNIPIGSQISHAVGLAYASKLQKKGEVAIVYIGDGGTSHGEFHEGVNFGAVFSVPMVVIIQNNGWAISTPRAKQTKSETLAQKAIAYGIPGIQVDGNDILAMYAISKEAIERAREGKGPSLIEAITYRMGPHTTSDNPSIYRSDEEVKLWEKKDPIHRFRNYLIKKQILTEEADRSLNEELSRLVLDTFKEVEQTGLIPLEDIFSYTYETMTPQLMDQYEKYKNYLEKEGI